MTSNTDKHNHPKTGANLLSPPIILDTYQTNIMYPNAVPETGAIVRISTNNMVITKGDDFTVLFEGKTTYTDTSTVSDTRSAIDFTLPKSLILENITDGGITKCTVLYRIKPLTGPDRDSDITPFSIFRDLPSLPPPVIPSIADYKLNPHTIPEPGLEVRFPSTNYIRHARWRSYARNGELMNEEIFAIYNQSAVITTNTLKKTVPGGNVRVDYYGKNSDGELVPSLPIVLKVIKT
ncbi:hypothetical protein T3H00_24950 [Pseudomonas fluorescens]|uniref:hypothetical protein n=1 Tax=Pseudomonas fluorescens TaxID=294 RepID=UPI002ACAD4AF|nr:hypothetical protein [Pseudomonas fluorescens]MDZ5435898.1 hypothetical protein [Pseudomonas fluorescens]